MNILNNSSITNIDGIGTKNIQILHKLGIYKIIDLLEYYPFRYNVLDINQEINNKTENVVINGIVCSEILFKKYGPKKNSLSFILKVNQTKYNIIIFNREFIKNKLKLDTNITVVGKYDFMRNVIVANEIRFEVILEKTIEPVYSITTGVTSKGLEKYIKNAYSHYGLYIPEYIPSKIREKYRLLTKTKAIELIHFPHDEEDIKQAKRSLKYEELFLFSLKMQALKAGNVYLNKGISRNIDFDKINHFIKDLPFELTNDQQHVIQEILSDLKEPYPMNRLLQGDVGSGKTVVAGIAIYANYLSGYQSAMMAPTEILAEQHFQSFKDLFGDNLRMALLTGSTKQSERNYILELLVNNEIDLIIGTHALIQDNVTFSNLGLVITDEQHRFGVNQRALLKRKGNTADVLYMSATPIPRTLALTVFGDMDVSTIKTMPVGRKVVKTYYKTMKELHDILDMILNEVKLGHQVYVVTPLIEESDKIDLIDSYKMYENLKVAFKNKLRMDLLHGRMSTYDKDLIMDRFKRHDVDLLVSTTVIEVGVNIPNATLMVIFDANRFGLSQLHQLRGRVGRGNAQSYCVLVSDKVEERLEVLTKTNDGFTISEADLRLRGPGDFFGERQSGILNFKLANIIEDSKMLEIARKDAIDIYNSNDFNSNKEYQVLREYLMATLKDID